MYRIKLAAQARKELKGINKLYQNAIRNIFAELRENPQAGKPLTRELIGSYSYKVGVYRIIYKINKRDKIIYVLTAGHRKNIYL